MYKFVNVNEKGDIIKVIVKSDDLNLNELLEHFKSFCVACTFSQTTTDRIVLLEDNEEVVEKDEESEEE